MTISERKLVRRRGAFNVRPHFLALLALILLTSALPVWAEPVPVRFTEGMVRGFLELQDTGGKRIASGDYLQSSQAGDVKCRTVLHFKDGSLHDETAVFTQRNTFVMKSYRLIQRGKAFEADMDVTVNRSNGAYRVRVAGKDRREKVLEGKLDLPQDVYNGMIPIIMKNLHKGRRQTVHIVAFTPAPKVIELEMAPSGNEKMLVGDLDKSAVHYVLKPKLGLLRLPATLVGRNPPDNHIWTVMDELPAFVKFTGPLAVGGSIWTIELTSPRWPK